MVAQISMAPGLVGPIFAKLGAEASAKCALCLVPLAEAVEKQAKINASSGKHKRGTPTPASPGSGPAQISGTLVACITHSAVTRSATGWHIKVGTAAGTYPPYSSRTPASRYGYYLETGLKNGARYPWLAPAVHMVNHIAIHAIFAKVLGTLGR